MAKALTVTELTTEIRRDIDETTASTSYFTDADIAAYLNRTLEWVGNGMPARTVKWTITGDGSAVDFSSPEQVSDFHTVVSATHPQPRITYAKSVVGAGTISLLTDWFSAYGFSIRIAGGQIRAQIKPAMASGDTRDVHFIGLPGTIKSTPYSTGTVDIVTKGDATITGESTVWTTNAAVGDAMVIDGEYYVIKSVTSNTVLELTEVFREASQTTGAGISYEIGGSTGLPASFNDLLRYGVQWRLERKRKSPEWQTTQALAKREFWTQSAYLENIMAPNDALGLSL